MKKKETKNQKNREEEQEDDAWVKSKEQSQPGTTNGLVLGMWLVVSQLSKLTQVL